MSENQTQREQKNNENKGRGLFYGVIAVATFIIMAVGATFAYFTATTSSPNSTVKTGSATLELQYISYQSGWMNTDLIPANTNVVEYSFENQNDTTLSTKDTLNNTLCKDDFGNSICSTYVFQVRNNANSPQNVSLDVVSEENGFTNLYAMAYEISVLDGDPDYDNLEEPEAGGAIIGRNGANDPIFRKETTEEGENLIDVVNGAGELLSLRTETNTDPTKTYTPIYINRKGVTKTLLKYVVDNTGETTTKRPAIDRKIQTIADGTLVNEDDPENVASRTANIAGDITIDGGETKTFAIVLYIKNENFDQTASDAAKTFTGRVLVSSGDGKSGVSGYIGSSEGVTLQSDTASGE